MEVDDLFRLRAGLGSCHPCYLSVCSISRCGCQACLAFCDEMHIRSAFLCVFKALVYCADNQCPSVGMGCITAVS